MFGRRDHRPLFSDRSARRRWPRRLLIALLIVAGIGGLAWSQRLLILQYSLGWHTDWKHPRGPNQPVPWTAGPAEPPPAWATGSERRPPNIIVILADDLGINDVTTHGGGWAAQGVPTPNLDAMAQAGVRFDNGYASSAVCTVSRAGLMTGRYPWRFGVEFTPTPGAMARVAGSLYDRPGRLNPVVIDHKVATEVKDFNELGMPDTEQTLAEMLKARGYHTVHIGKWHLGSTAQMRPNNQGFNESLFMESGLYLPVNDPGVVNSKQDFDPIDKFLWPNMRYGVSYNGGAWFEPKGYLTDYFTDEAVKVIQQNKHRPFLLYLAHWGVHTPMQAAKADYDALPQITDHRRRVYASMIRSVDRSVGRVLQTLREQGLERDTLVVFTSDNGAPGYIGLPEVNRPYRGWKLTLFEGGVRVPFVAQWPGTIPAGTRYQTPVSNIDITPTAVAAAGAQLPADRPIDGVNLLPHLAATAPATPTAMAATSTAGSAKPLAGTAKPPSSPTPQPLRPLFWRDGSYRSVQVDGWKLIVSARPAKQWLFNLRDDPTEKRNLINDQPAQATRLKALLDEHHANMPKPLWASFIEMPVLIDKTLDQREEPGDEVTYWIN